MKTTLNITISKTKDRVEAVAIGVSATASDAYEAVKGLMGALHNKHKALESAANYNSLSDAAVKEMVLLRAIFLK